MKLSRIINISSIHLLWSLYNFFLKNRAGDIACINFLGSIEISLLIKPANHSVARGIVVNPLDPKAAHI